MSKTLRIRRVGLLCFVVAVTWHHPASHFHSSSSPIQQSTIASIPGLAPGEKSLSNYTLKAITSGIRQREYHIQYSDKAKEYRAPNRANELNAAFQPGSYRIESREQKNDELTLSTHSITADGQPISSNGQQPEASTDGQQLDFAFADYTEQYINNDEGVRQNFIISKPGAALEVQLKVSGMQADQVHDSLIMFSKNELYLSYSGLRAWDAAGKPLSASLHLNNDIITLAVDSRGAQFPVTIDPIIAAGTPVNANTLLESNLANARFGTSVSGAGDLNGDGYNDIVVGAPNYANGHTLEGAIYVYYGSAAGMGTTAVRIESDNANALLGTSVSFAGDINGDGYGDLIAGAPARANGGSTGACLVFYGSATGITTTPSLIVTNPSAGANNFGYSVSGAGDVNGDGYSDVVIGAPAYANGHAAEGAIYVYLGSSTGLSTTVHRTVESNFTNAQLGFSVSGAGDVNADGYSDIVAGAPGLSNGSASEGGVYVWRGSATGIVTPHHILAEGNTANYRLGTSVAGVGDINGDGFADVLAGLPGYSTNAGRAWCFYGAGTMSTTASFTFDPGIAAAQFGCSVASAGDVNGDGFSDVIIGSYAYNNSPAQTNEGAAYVYHGGTTLVNTPASTIQANLANAYLGTSVKGMGDVNGDGYSDLIIGAPRYNNGSTEEGIILIYHGSPGSINTGTYTSRHESNRDDSYLGVSVASAGDINGDGYNDVVAGADWYSNGQNDEGAVFVYHGSATGLPATPTLTIQSNRDDTQLGFSISSAGDINGDGYSDVIAGGYFYTNGQDEEGAAYIWLGSATGLNTASQVIIQGNQDDAHFGISVSSAGDVNGDGYSDVIVGAPGATYGQNGEGSAFIYHGSATGINTTAATHLQPNQNNAQFGFSVAGAGDINGDGYSDVVVGAPGYDGTYNNGTVFVYRGSAAGISAASAVQLNAGRNNTRLGSAVSGAGDVNGDGFSDIILGADEFNNGQSNEGRIQVHFGSSSGITSTPATTVESNRADAGLGYSVAGVGDINGDGYADVAGGAMRYENGTGDEGAYWLLTGSASGLSSAVQYEPNAVLRMGWSLAGAGDVNGDGIGDLLVGTPWLTNGQSREGGFQLHLGNNSPVNAKRKNLRLYNTGTTTPITRANIGSGDFSAGLFGRSFDGRTKGKLVWETREKGQAFSTGTTMTNSTQRTGIQASWNNLGASGTELNSVVTKAGSKTKIRARIAFDPATSLTGQVYGPWTYPQDIIGGRDMSGSPLPVTLEQFTATAVNNNKVLLRWQTATELNNDRFEIERSADRSHWETISTVKGNGTSSAMHQYSHTDLQPHTGVSFYRLKQVDIDGTPTWSVIRSVSIEGSISLSAWPNPVRDQLTVNASSVKDLRLYSQSGQQLSNSVQIQRISNNKAIIDMRQLAPGTYFLKAGTKTITIIKQ